MIKNIDKNAILQKTKKRIRSKISGTACTPRFAVCRSEKHIYVQLIDDVAGHTLVAASTIEKEIVAEIKGKTKKEAAKIVGAFAARRAIDKGINNVVFDRGGHIYTGRIEAIATGAREAGLQF